MTNFKFLVEDGCAGVALLCRKKIQVSPLELVFGCDNNVVGCVWFFLYFSLVDGLAGLRVKPLIIISTVKEKNKLGLSCAKLSTA